MNNIEEQISGAITSLLQNIENEKWDFIHEKEELLDELFKLKQMCKSNFDYLSYLNLGIMPKIYSIFTIVTGISPSIYNTHMVTNIINSNCEHFFRQYIMQREDWSCYVDKARFIVNKMIESIIKGENLSLYVNYEGMERIDKSKWNEQAYWSPKTIRDTDGAFKLFNDWYDLKLI